MGIINGVKMWQCICKLINEAHERRKEKKNEESFK